MITVEDVAELDPGLCADQAMAAEIAVKFVDQPAINRVLHHLVPDLSSQHRTEQGMVEPVTQLERAGTPRSRAAILRRAANIQLSRISGVTGWGD